MNMHADFVISLEHPPFIRYTKLMHNTNSTVHNMSGLLQLANEILYQIINNVSPDDIINLSLCSKEVHRLCHDALKLHQERTNSFSSMVFRECAIHKEGAHPIALLAEICNDWRVAYYVTSMTVDCFELEYWQEEMDVEMETSEGQNRDLALDILFKKLSSDMQGLMSESPYLKKANTFDSIPQYCWKDVRDSALGLLLVLLPNLKSVSLSDNMWQAKTCRKVLGRIISCHALPDSHEQSRPMPLSNLAEVKIYGSGAPYHLEANLGFFEYWVSLPSTNSLFGSAVVSFSEFDWHHALKSSNVTDINLQKSSVLGKHLGQLLSGIKALRRFTYDYDEQLYNRGGDHGPKIVRTLLKHTRSTLESLTITGYMPSQCFMGGISLKPFETLKIARFPCCLFLKDEADFEGEDDEVDLKMWLDDIPRLINLLPATIEKIELDGEIKMGSVESLLIDMDGPDQELLIPNLKKIVFNEAFVETKTMKMMAKAWKDGLRASGISLQL